MAKPAIFLANSELSFPAKNAEGDLITIEGEEFFAVKNVDAMPPFLMSIVSDSDHWMFISSSGGVTAGRKNADHALFPYYTDDKIHESAETSGSKTIVRVDAEKGTLLWEPFSDKYMGAYRVSRNLYKSTTGNSVIFEEINHDLGLGIRVKWMNSDHWGWVKETLLLNHSNEEKVLSMLDGLVNILPYGILKSTQEQFSTLMDAYKQSDLASSGLGVFSMSSIPVDRAEPSEALKATTVWCSADDPGAYLLSTDQLPSFRETGTLETEKNKRGIRGAFFVQRTISLKPGSHDSHLVVAEVDQDSSEVHNLDLALNSGQNLAEKVLENVRTGTQILVSMVKASDGVQHSGNRRTATRHFSNVLFNIMRGGLFEKGYQIDTIDLAGHVKRFNKTVHKQYRDWLASLDNPVGYTDLVRETEKKDDPDLYRIVMEYLPLTFSRRHGDPSRPWNRFSIEIKNPDGTRSFSYEGNWRDIFQNWEALSYSYPLYLPAIINKFLNASTADGYNPYRITHRGIDWEVFDPSDPWSFIGYWGDHQVIYLLKLLELSENVFPESLQEELEKDHFVFAHVPYRIRPYSEIVKDPNRTIDFDQKWHQFLQQRYDDMGADGKLLTDSAGSLIRVNMMEKLLVMVLTKLSNFIPGAGLWLNTQRPEWNDANNALVGNGVSMVTLFYLRRFLSFFASLLPGEKDHLYSLSPEVSSFLDSIHQGLTGYLEWDESPITGEQRKKITDELGRAGSSYRNAVYAGHSGKKVRVRAGSIREMTEHALQAIDQTIRENERSDHLYHAYNLIELSQDAIEITRLPLMLEGQVAALSSGFLDAGQTKKLLDSLKNSPLYREDQQSYMLYPDREPRPFWEKNTIPGEYTTRYPVLQKLADMGGKGIITRDQSGTLHFAGAFKNAAILEEHLDHLLEQEELQLQPGEINDLFEVYELLFNHHAFTGRSGSFFKYEGLGSIYWHMVSKLGLAVAENISRVTTGSDYEKHLPALLARYREVKAGIGAEKNPEEYGAIPTDPYSHTPAMYGAQQPGMTGQVKEDIISRWIELGIEIADGSIHFHGDWIDPGEFDDGGKLEFTFCGIPFTYVKGSTGNTEIHLSTKKHPVTGSHVIGPPYSREIFGRSGNVEKVVVHFS